MKFREKWLQHGTEAQNKILDRYMVNIVLRFNTLDNQKEGRTIAVHVAADDMMREFEKFRV